MKAVILPTDFQLKSLLHDLNRLSLNMELHNISFCMASKHRTEWSVEYEEKIHAQLKRMVRNGGIVRRRFLPGRPYYSPW